uniref:Adenylate/guanylate cyclase domain-containing protein n=1 Tax=Desulfobacca acetoxidans TaxID=60893 RepID=A0A7C5ALG4_9BACT
MLFISEFLHHPLWVALGLALGAWAAVAPLAALELGRSLENYSLDLGYRLQPATSPPPEILIVGLDLISIQAFGSKWPCPREYHARLIRRLTEAGAAIIVFDLFFGEPTDPAQDENLAQAMRSSGKVVLARLLETAKDPRFFRQIELKPLKILCDAALGLGVSLLTPDSDGVVRRFRLSPAGQETLPEVVVRHLKPKTPLPPGLTGLINYEGLPRTLKTISYHQALDETQPLSRELVEGRIVLVGRVLDDVPFPQAQVDAFLTPLDGSRGDYVSGVEIQGHILHTLLTGTWGRELSLKPRLGLYLGIFLIFALLLVHLSPALGLGLLVTAGLGLFWAALALFNAFGLWIFPVLGELGLILVLSGHLMGLHFLELSEKRRLRRAFVHFVAPEVVEVLLAYPDQLELGGTELEVTVMFADLAGLKDLTAHTSAQDLIQLLSDYFTPMTEIVLAYGGTLDKYMDSSLMAVWGAPLPLSDHARRACQAALALEYFVEETLRERQARGQPYLGLHLSLHSGPVMAGNVGSRERLNYTILGDTVNLASRLVEVNRYYGTRMILTENTRFQAGAGFLLRELDRVQVLGRLQPVTVFELLWLAPGENAPLWQTVFRAGRLAYLECSWSKAARHFEEVLRLRPGDGPATLFLNRCRDFLLNPPPPEWQGVTVLETKTFW